MFVGDFIDKEEIYRSLTTLEKRMLEKGLLQITEGGKGCDAHCVATPKFGEMVRELQIKNTTVQGKIKTFRPINLKQITLYVNSMDGCQTKNSRSNRKKA